MVIYHYYYYYYYHYYYYYYYYYYDIIVRYLKAYIILWVKPYFHVRLSD